MKKSICIGDLIWCKAFGSDDVGYGSVRSLFNNNGEEFFYYHDVINGGERLSSESRLIKDPGVRYLNKLAKIIKSNREK